MIVVPTRSRLALPGALHVPLAQRAARRFAAAGLPVIKVVAVFSLAEIAAAALAQHPRWGSLLVGLPLWSPGRWSVNALLAPRLPDGPLQGSVAA